MCDAVVNLAHTIFVKLDVSSLGISAPANWDPLHVRISDINCFP